MPTPSDARDTLRESPEPAALPEPVALPEDERHRLLDVARTAVGVAARALPPDSLQGTIGDARGTGRCAAAFVTLTQGGALRGCMGMLDPERSVVESVIEAAACAARTDPRFPPVRPAELESLHLEVSIMGPLIRLSDPLAFQVGVDGIVVERAGRRGLLLPEVAEALDNDRVAMLDIACRKAALPSDAWREPGTAVYAFRTDRFGGPLRLDVSELGDRAQQHAGDSDAGTG